jgi:hypothetical protein
MGCRQLTSHGAYGSVQLGIGVAKLTGPAQKLHEIG